MRFIIESKLTLLCLLASGERPERHRRRLVLTVSAQISRRRFGACLQWGDASARGGPGNSLRNRCVLDKQRQRLSLRTVSTRAFAVPAGGSSQPLQRYTSTLSGKPFWGPRTPIAHAPIYSAPSVASCGAPASWSSVTDRERHHSHEVLHNFGWASAMTGLRDPVIIRRWRRCSCETAVWSISTSSAPQAPGPG